MEENCLTAVRFHKAVQVCGDDENIQGRMKATEVQQLADQDTVRVVMASIILNMMAKAQ